MDAVLECFRRRAAHCRAPSGTGNALISPARLWRETTCRRIITVVLYRRTEVRGWDTGRAIEECSMLFTSLPRRCRPEYAARLQFQAVVHTDSNLRHGTFAPFNVPSRLNAEIFFRRLARIYIALSATSTFQLNFA